MEPPADDKTAQGEAADDEEIVTPPDNVVAEEMAEGPQDFQQSGAVSTTKEALKAV